MEAHGRSLQEVGFQWHWLEDRSVSRSDRYKRLEEGESRSLRDGRRSALQGGGIAAASSGLEVQACCSRALRWTCVAGEMTGRASAQPGRCQWRTLFLERYTHLLWLCMRRQSVRVETFVVCHSVW